MGKNSLNNIQLNNLRIAYLVFLLSPIFALFLSFFKYKENWPKNIVWFFSSFYGFTFVIGNKSSDINRYKSSFDELLNSQLNFFGYLGKLIAKGETDFLQQSIFYFLSKTTSNFSYVLLIIGLIYGYFLSRNIWYVLSLNKLKLSKIAILMILVFSFLFAVWDINVMRFTLAAQIFFYGIFNYVINKKKSGLLFVFISPFMHFSFTIAIGVFLLHQILGNITKLFFIFFIISFTISEINLEVFKNQFGLLPEIYSEKTEDYINEEYKEQKDEMTENKNFNGKFYQSSLKWSVGILLSFIYLNRKKIKGNISLENLLAFTLLFIAIFNILSVIPSMNRFQFMGYLFAFALFCSFFNGVVNKNEKIIIIICTPFILFYFFIKLRIGLEFTGLFTILGGPISAIFNDGDVALIEFFK